MPSANSVSLHDMLISLQDLLVTSCKDMRLESEFESESSTRRCLDRAKSGSHADQNVVCREIYVRIVSARSAFEHYEYA